MLIWPRVVCGSTTCPLAHLVVCFFPSSLSTGVWKRRGSPPGKHSFSRLLEKLKTDLPYEPAIPLLRIYPKECKSGYDKGICTPNFIAILFRIVKLWRQPRYPTTDERIKKMWYLYTMEFYSAINKNEILLFAGKWMELENTTLSEVSQVQEIKGHIFSLICGIQT
jgi:hypothetical protein